MSKVTSKAVFKAYDQQQVLLLPPQLGDLIPSHHLVRVVNAVVEQMDLSDLINQYEGGGTSSYHPKMMVKVLLYGYAMKIYTGRKLAKALQQDITFMWLAAYNRPDFRTLNLFRSGILKETIEELFKQLLLFLVDHGLIKIENYFTDGTTFSADANKHKMVWKKNAERYKQLAEEKCRALFKEIDALNEAEENQYGEQDLEEMGKQPIDHQGVAQQVEKLNQVISKTSDKRQARKAESLKKKVEKQLEKVEHYNEQLTISEQRSGYSKTDVDATAMFMKNQELLPAYNVVASSENQFITAFSLHQNPNDATCFKEHLEQLPLKPAAIMADSIFGTEQNYELLEGHNIESYLKFPTFHREQTQAYKTNPFLKENFTFNAIEDTYTCPDNKTLRYRNTEASSHKKTGYRSVVRIYQAEDCTACSLASSCKKSEERSRIIKVNQQLDFFKNQARSNLNSQKGLALRRARGMEIESCFGDIKHNMGFRRFHLRGKQKVKTEIGLISMAHNLRKVQIHILKKAA
jgi:transposase